MIRNESRTICDDNEAAPLARSRPFTGVPLQRRYYRSRWEGVAALLLVLLPVLIAMLAFSSVARGEPARIAAANPIPRMPPGLVININIADSAQLSLIPGLTETKIQNILLYRAKHSFQAPADLMKVKGIGPATYARVKPWITVDGPPVREVDVKPAV